MDINRAIHKLYKDRYHVIYDKFVNLLKTKNINIYRGDCPFCKDSGKLLINNHTGRFSCEHCGIEGDLTGFIKQFNFINPPKKAEEVKEKQEVKKIKETPLMQEVKKWVSDAKGEFYIRDILIELNIKEKFEKKELLSILKKLIQDQEIEKASEKRGHYRVTENDLREMDLENADTNFLDIVMPFNIHKMAGLMPGNIVVIAGEKDSGKTSLCLNIIKDNMQRFNIHYFNSEMSEGELKLRLQKFGGQVDWRFKAYSRSNNFQQVIKSGPGNINIIDFLEIHDKFYLAAEYIKQIHERLDGAIAIIAMQKSQYNEFGRGGEGTLEKARLALNLRPGNIKIKVAKNPINSKKPAKDFELNFKLDQGTNFKAVDKWHIL